MFWTLLYHQCYNSQVDFHAVFLLYCKKTHYPLYSLTITGVSPRGTGLRICQNK
ncbi:hypothetical protein I7I50_09527 [Histoplasma capsulatum G186AR]|uniref:Uncharacterized protein n=1 Tax=Ajellomyces capsulatus TaxID=5037 RepID=A0A8H7YSD4_AJECA|nr:hypothetical protein I7I52_07048 [Histoplasma capsulatum]QSS74389.1 hypothetical protein I7I50_09527 [Histoplasma capsulatum G186AR]